MSNDPESTDSEPTFFNHTFEETTLPKESAYAVWIKLSLSVLLFASITIILIKSNLTPNQPGVITQFQVMISVYLTMNFKKLGTLIAIVINGFQGLISLTALVVYSNPNALAGVIFSVSSIIIIFIISTCMACLSKNMEEVLIKNTKLASLNEKLAMAHNEMEQQNELLMAYNRIIKENEKKLSYQAFFDTLTELPNRNVLINRMDMLITSPENENLSFGVVFMDLDNFKEVNDTLGHHIGDLLLKDVAVKLKRVIHPDDLLGRLGGDEFALIIKRPLEKEAILAYMEKLELSLMKDIVIENKELSVSASFGFAIYPQDGHSSTELLKCADGAMYKAKNHKKLTIDL
ncbi:GGDEF domain-containing protein [Acetobacterium bakii]|uniref:GGDEF domain-containing protein n=1 Tax=Acetobacterium bakii TaxID=52689 RepID=A0A0L6U3P2_9FIRM|nr:GGDEF domain-containing protein [Acetobacterium bakii]KNZ43144.1 hypothetical protein AKG39_03085 [Acetobacterium bakii]